MAELGAKNFERYAVLQRKGNNDSEGVHEPCDGRACLGHADKDLTRLAVLVKPDHQIALVPAHRKVVDDSLAFFRQPAAWWLPHCFCDGLSNRRLSLHFQPPFPRSRVQRLATLSAVA